MKQIQIIEDPIPQHEYFNLTLNDPFEIQINSIGAVYDYEKIKKIQSIRVTAFGKAKIQLVHNSLHLITLATSVKEPKDVFNGLIELRQNETFTIHCEKIDLPLSQAHVDVNIVVTYTEEESQ